MIISLYTLLTAISNSFADQMSGLMDQEGVDIVVQSKYATNPLSSLIPLEQVRQIRDMKEVKSQVPIVLGRKRFANRDMIYLFGIDGIVRMAIQKNSKYAIHDCFVFRIVTITKIGVGVGQIIVAIIMLTRNDHGSTAVTNQFISVITNSVCIS